MLDLEQLSAGIAGMIAPLQARLEAAEKALSDLRAQPAPVSVVGALIDREGGLVLTFSNGETKSLGCVVGASGADGKDGADGLGFEDMEFGFDPTGRPYAEFARGEVVKYCSIPAIIDRGIWREGVPYKSGDAVTWGGSLWIAQKDMAAGKPDGGDDWRLAVKRGRDGKSAEGAR